MLEDGSAAATAGACQECPECGIAVPVDPQYVTWCDGCGWNTDRGEAPPPAGRLAAFQRRLARRHGEQLYAELSGAAAGRPRRDAAAIGAYALAALVHGLTLALLAGGVLLVVLGWSTVIQPVIGVVLLGLVFVLRPRLGRLDADLPTLHRDDLPRLFALLDEVARELGTRPVDAVQFDAEVNACVYAYGLRRRRCLRLGLGLWEILTPQQRVALLGHEFAHYVNGDLRDGLVVGSAQRSLHAWAYVLTPENGSVPVRGSATLTVAVSHLLMSALLVLPRAAARGTAMLLAQLTVRASQRAEYHADDIAARTASGTAAASCLEQLLLGGTVRTEMRRLSVLAGVRGGSAGRREIEAGLWDQVAVRAAAVPPRERERLRRAAQARAHAVDDTHPPTHLRIARLHAREAQPARVVLNEADASAIDAELAATKARIAREVVRDFAARG